MDPLIAVDGKFVSQKALHIAELIHDLNPDLSLEYVPQTEQYRIRHSPVGASSYIVMYVDGKDLDHRIIAQLWKADTTKHNVLDGLELEERAAEILKRKQQIERLEERRDFAVSVLSSKKSVYRHDGKEYR